jgi:hypothetical protein
MACPDRSRPVAGYYLAGPPCRHCRLARGRYPAGECHEHALKASSLASCGEIAPDLLDALASPSQQQVMFGLLGLLGRMRGYRGSIPSILTPTAAPPQIQRCLRSPGRHHRIRVLQPLDRTG